MSKTKGSVRLYVKSDHFFMRNRRCDYLCLRHRWQNQRSKSVAFFDRTFVIKNPYGNTHRKDFCDILRLISRDGNCAALYPLSPNSFWPVPTDGWWLKCDKSVPAAFY